MSLGSTLNIPDHRAAKETPMKATITRGYFRPKVGAALTPRELECYRMMVQAYTRKETATQLGISIGSAKVLCFRVLAKSGARSTGELIRRHAKELISSPEVRIGPFE